MAINISVNEQSTAYLDVDFKDRFGELEIPLTVSYRIDEPITKRIIRAPTSLTPAAELTITLSISDNTISDQSRRYEQRKVTVTADYGASERIIDEFFYTIRNLDFID